ncbi:MAG: hypothetical protein DWI57_09120, partial [Chloroflexi bacterium]
MFLVVLRKRRVLIAGLLVLLTVAAFMPVFSAPLTESAAVSAIPPVSEIGKYLVISMGDDANIGRAFQMSNSEIGADRKVLSTANDPGCVTDGGLPNLLGVFGTRWNTATNPDSLNSHTPLFQGIDWSGEVALTSDNGTFDSSNSLVWADTGIQTVDASPLASVSNTKYMDVGNSNCAGANIAIGTGVTTGNSFATLLSDLSSWKSYIEGLSAESSITNQSAWTNNSAAGGAGGLITTYADALDTNSDGVIVVDFNISGQDFSVNNTDWIINGTGNKLVIFRLRNGSNMLISNGSITLGTGGIANNDLGVIFYSGYDGNSSDAVFSFSNVVASGTGFWDLNAVGEGGGSINTNIVINNGQGCAQFISQKVNFQNNRWNLCAPRAAPSLDYGDAPDTGAGTAQGNYNTLATDNGPSHAIVANLRLGAVAPDADAGTLQNAAATADDTNNSDDEDGVTTLPSVTTASASVPLAVSVFNNTGAASTLACWIDFNRDGDFVDTGERASTTVSVSGSQQTANLTFTGFTAPSAGFSYLRCRLASAAGDVTNPTGAASTGEVEDYQVTIELAGGAIGDFVWYDADKDGIEDVGEPGIPNVTLDLYKDTDGTPGLNTATDTKVESTVTDADGGYLFSGLEPGTYFVDVTDLNGQLTGLTHIVANQSQSDPTPAIVLASGQVYKDADFGYVDNSPGKAMVGDTVWYDDNGDGIQQPSEPGIPNVTVNIRNSSGTIIGSDDTDTNGHYLVKVDPGNGYTAAPDPADIPPGLTATTPVPYPLPLLSAGDQYLDADFGYNDGGNLLGTIGNLVFEDKNNNGVFNGSPEVGMPGVSVDLIRDTNGNKIWESGEPVIATVTTDKDGGYLFTGVPAGNYLVHVSDTSGVLLNHNKSNLGTAGADNNNQVDPYAITLVAGADNLTADFGYRKIDPNLGQIGNQVWVESDGNGLFNPTGSDVGQAGVTVSLYRNGSPYATTTTGASGDYLFTQLPSGTYTVTVSDSFNVLDDWIVTTLGPNQGSDDNNQLQPYQIVLLTGGENLTADFGYTRPSAIGDFVWYDADKDGIEDVDEPGIPNVTLNLYRDKDGSGTITAGDPLIGTKVTDADGGYLFPGLVAGDYIVDVTDTNNKLAGLTQIVANQAKPDPTAKIVLGAGVKYEDADFGYVKEPTAGKAVIGDTVWYDDNGDGIQQPNEPGIPGIQVCATPVGVGVAVCDTTDDNGLYLVEVNAGTYRVAPTAGPSGLTATTPVPHGPVTVDAGEQYLDADFGYNDNGSLLGTAGNLVFVEDKASRDGIYNGSDKPLAGVSVSLIRDTNGNKVWDAGEPIIATTTTTGTTDGNNGNYLFTGLRAGNYLLHVSDTNAVLLDYNRTILGPSQGSDNNNQADPYGFNLLGGSQNLTADFGYYRTDRPDVGVIGNQVWTETDGDGIFNVNSGDVGQAGVTVELLKDGVLYDTTTTGASGDYSFVGLPAGNYTTRVTDSLNVLAGHRVTTLGPNQGNDNNNQLQPYTISLPKDGVNLTADFGYVLPPSSFSLTKRTITPSPVRPGTTISFSIRITNTGSTWLMKLPLSDTYDKEYIGYLSSVPVSVDNNNDGTINWTDLLNGVGPLAPGASVQVIANFVSIKDTGSLTNSETINVATVSGAISDPDGPGVAPTSPTPLPDQSSQDVVEIINPTAVLLANSQVSLGDNGALLAWQTVSEANVAGFHLLRINPDGSTTRLTEPSLPLPAQKP